MSINIKLKHFLFSINKDQYFEIVNGILHSFDVFEFQKSYIKFNDSSEKYYFKDFSNENPFENHISKNKDFKIFGSIQKPKNIDIYLEFINDENEKKYYPDVIVETTVENNESIYDIFLNMEKGERIKLLKDWIKKLEGTKITYLENNIVKELKIISEVDISMNIPISGSSHLLYYNHKFNDSSVLLLKKLQNHSKDLRIYYLDSVSRKLNNLQPVKQIIKESQNKHEVYMENVGSFLIISETPNGLIELNKNLDEKVINLAVSELKESNKIFQNIEKNISQTIKGPLDKYKQENSRD
jgi:hypothetical protein